MRTMYPALVGLSGVACASVLALGVASYQPFMFEATAPETDFVPDSSGGEYADQFSSDNNEAPPSLSESADSVPGGAVAGDHPRPASTTPLAKAKKLPPPARRRTYRVTAYCDPGTTACGKKVGVGQCAAPVEIPFGSRIYIPKLGRTFVVTDRTDFRFRHNTVDIYVPGEARCWQFGRNYLECHVYPPDVARQKSASR